MTTQAKVIIEVDTAEGITPASVAARLALPTNKAQDECERLANYFSSLPQRQATVRVRVDSALGVAAARTLTINGAAVIAGEYIGITIPGVGTWKVTGVASGAAAGDGTFDVSGTSNTAATNIRAAINSLGGLRDWVTASGTTNAVIITANARGTFGNTIRIVDGTGGGIGAIGALTGGIDPNARVTGSFVITNANVTAPDTVTIGSQTFTAVSSGAAGNQFNIGASATLTGDNIVAAINANAQLAGILSASNDAGTVTLTYVCDPRVALHIRLATSDATAFALTQPASGLTLASVQATRTYQLGRQS